MDFAFQFNGGIGKIICSTSLVEWVSKKYPKSKITVISSFPEIFEHNPKVYRNLKFDTPYLFEDYIKGKDFREGDPYRMHEYYNDKDKQHIMELFPKAYGFKEYNKDPDARIYLTEGEIQEAKQIALNGPPIITLQHTGGIVNSPKKTDFGLRDMPVHMAETIAAYLIKKGFRVIQVKAPNEPGLRNALRLNMPVRNWLALSSQVVAHIGMDSFMMHSCATFKKPMLIFWSETHVDNLGYTYNGVFNKHRKGSMKCRPHVGMPDIEGMYPYKDKDGKEAWNYSQEEIINYLDEFTDFIKKT